VGAEERGALRGQAGSLTPPRAYPTVPKGGGHVNLEHARVGKKVRVRGDRRRPELRGTVVSVLRCYGEPEYLALEVALKGGRPRVFWHHELEELGGGTR
jgi:hypothetical protein